MVYNGKLFVPEFLQRLCLYAPTWALRSRPLFYCQHARLTLQSRMLLRRLPSIYNDVSNEIDLDLTDPERKFKSVFKRFLLN